MQITPPRYLVSSGRHPIIDDLAPELQSWFVDALTEPIPEKFAAILRRMDVQPVADGLQPMHGLRMATG